jgi:4-hydroxy-tetrahydrodipicolinate synthase
MIEPRDRSTVNFHIEGIVPPLVTPLRDSNELDKEGLERLIEHVIEGGVQGIFILGTTGEMSRLSHELKDEMIHATCKIVGKRIPVLVGITDTSIHETLRLEQIASDAGAEAVVLAPPFYYHVEQNELMDYFTEIADTIGLPLFLYNMPSRTHITIEVDTILKVADHPRIHGIKDSSGDLIYVQNLIYSLNGHEDFSIFIGPEEIMAQSVLLGAEGGVNGGANLYPKLFVEMYRAARERNISVVNDLQLIITHISNTLYRVGVNQPNYTKIIKEALAQKGICGPYMEKPYIPFSETDRNKIKDCISNIAIPEEYLNLFE